MTDYINVCEKHKIFLNKLKEEFKGLTKKQLEERASLAYDELVKVIAQRRGLELFLKSQEYFKCPDCDKWRKDE